MTDNDLLLRSADTAPSVVETSATAIDTSKIIGWGVDADPENDPTYSYRDRSADDHSGTWRRPAQQEREVEILKSVEHKQLPAVFGTASPPKWISGWMRRLAFRWTESNWAHWLLLMGADRVNMVEGLVEDVARGKLPNIPKEMGIPAEWKHNKTGLMKKIGIAALIGGALFALTRWRREDDGDEGDDEWPHDRQDDDVVVVESSS
jgi:hypothetical protein